VIPLSRILIAGVLCFIGSLPGRAQGLNATRMVVVSDSLGAGFINFSLSADQQVQGFANLIARQAGTTLALPLIAEPGVPAKLTFNTQPPPVVVPSPGVSTGRMDPTVQATNLSVPGHTLADSLTRRPSLPIVNPTDQIQTLTNLVLGLPGLLANVSKSQVEWVEHFAQSPGTKPTLILAWVGSNDALFSVLIGNPAAVTPPAVFETLYSQMIDRLAATGATVVTANIPDVTALPYLTSAFKVVIPAAILTRMSPRQIYSELGISAGDYLLPPALEQVTRMALSRKFERLGPLCPPALPGLPGPIGCVLRAADIKALRTLIDRYNTIIAAKAKSRGIVLVDIHGLFEEIARRGVVVNRRRLTTGFLGGLFSLDGVHPTATGHAIVANEFIKTINTATGSRLPEVSVAQVASTDPMVLLKSNSYDE
jgi:lysophospholipase L1-like esterase